MSLAEYVECPGAYLPESGAVQISSDNDCIFNRVTYHAIRSAFAQAGRLDLFDRFKIASISFEEFTHFVQHHRKQLPDFVTAPAVARGDNRMPILTRGVTVTKEMRADLRLIKSATFEMLNYHGGSPTAVVLTADKIRLSLDVGPAEREYRLSEGNAHYKFPYEDKALRIKNLGMRWWCRDLNNLPFDINFLTS